MHVLTSTDARRAGVLRPGPVQRADASMRRTWCTGTDRALRTFHPRPGWCGPTLIWIVDLDQGARRLLGVKCGNATSISGGSKPMRAQSTRPKAQAAPGRALTILALLMVLLASATLTMQATPDRVTGPGTLAVSSLDCTVSDAGSRQTHCQGATAGILAAQRLTVAFLPVSGSRVWCYAAVTCGPAPAQQRLLRPPRPSVAPV